MKMDRREFIASTIAASAASAVPAHAAAGVPPRFAHRQAQMPLPPGENVFQLAAKIPGLSGVQLQMIWHGADISEGSTAAELKQQARANGMLTPSIAGIWKHGENIFSAHAAQILGNAIRTAHTLEAGVILVVMFKENCPDMSNPQSWEPAVALFKTMAPRAADAGVKLCIETSQSPDDDHLFVQRVDHPAFRVYFDATNCNTYHPGTAIPGILTLRHDIGEVHLKNENRLLSQQPAVVDWPRALQEYRDIHYNGWYCFETEHASPQACVDDTIQNMAFVAGNSPAAPRSPRITRLGLAAPPRTDPSLP
jgi:sugar phosphate isomerase/epimerase